MDVLHHYIGGRRVAGESGRFGPVHNASTGEEAASVPLASAEEAHEAVRVASAALADWANETPVNRARVMFRFKALIERDLDALAEALSREHGKVTSDAKGSIARGIEVVEFACGIPHLAKGEFSGGVGRGIDMYSLRQPVGVCVGITPFNFPAMVPLWMFPIALACGNSFILKPSEKDPSVPLMLAELLTEAGLPAGVFNVLNGDRQAVGTLIADSRVAAVSFVGSTPVAQSIYRTAAGCGKRVQAMGGAKNHLIVMPDADMDQTVDALMGAAYGSAGERCMAVSVAVAVGDAGDELMDRLKPRVESLKVGPSLDPESEMGPLVTAEHLEKVKGYVDLGLEEGAELVVDGREISIQGYENGFFMGGCLFDQVHDDMAIWKEEIFGPVLSVVRAADFEEALRLPSEHEFGNGVSIFTRDGDAARAFVERVEVGMVGVNVPIPVPLAFHGFGGWKASVYGALNQHGPDGVRFYTRTKTVTTRWPTGIRAGAEFTMPTIC